MRTRRFVSLLAFVFVIGAVALLPGAQALAAPGNNDQNTASESYYRLDVPNGTVTARVEATVQNAAGKDMTVAVLWAMPRAQNVQVTRDGEPLAIEVQSAFGDSELPTVVLVTLPRSLKSEARMDLEMTYDVPSQTSEYVRLEPGATEALFVSQGPGSFVLLDLPAAAENVLDPGCLKASDQPGDVKDAGLERWVCGEVLLIAFSADDPDTLAKCAGLDDRCRQRFDESPYSAFVQSISDPSLQGVLSETIPMGRGDVRVELKYFKRDQAWAVKQFDVAKRALPRLEAVFGFPYPYESITMRQSHHIEGGGAAGVAFSKIGEVLLATDTGFDEEVTTHELAHQWASRAKHFTDSFMSEGLAEFGQLSLAAELGYTSIRSGWDSYGYTDPLLTWHHGSQVANSNYWYGKSGAFWFAYQSAVGGAENMTRVLSQINDYEEQWPLDAGWFQDRGEEVSGANLDDLFLTWVYNRDTASGLIKSRRDAHTAVAPLRARAAEFGFAGLPQDIQENLDRWTFAAVPDQVAQASAVLDDYAKLVLEVDAAGLPQLENVKNSWNTGNIKDTAGVITDQRQALDAIVNSTKVLELELPGSPSLKELEAARQKWAEGDLGEAARLGAAAATTSFNEDAAVKMIALAKEKQASFQGSFLSRIGLLWQDPDAELVKAQAAYDEGNPTKAMELAQSAYKTWDTADRAGLMRLAGLMGVMCLLSGLVWWLLRRLDDAEPVMKRDPYAATGGHSIGDPDERRPSWQDWENSK